VAGTGERTVLLAAERSSNEEHTWVEQIFGLSVELARLLDLICSTTEKDRLRS
jgi:hypothetical protein